MDGKYMVNGKYSFKLSNYARDLILKIYLIQLILLNMNKVAHIAKDIC